MFAVSPNQKNSAVNLTTSESTETLTSDQDCGQIRIDSTGMHDGAHR